MQQVGPNGSNLDGTVNAEGDFTGTFHFANLGGGRVDEPMTGTLIATRTGATLSFTTHFNAGDPNNGAHVTVTLTPRA